MPDADTTIVGTDVEQTLTDKTLQAASATDPAVIIQGAAGQSAPLVVLQDSGGTELLRLDADGVGNSWVGDNAGAANTTGGANTAVGQSALLSNTTGPNNTAVGNGALVINTTGAGNTALGAAALSANTTGSLNTAVGVNAMQTNTTAIANTALGANALQFTTTGSDNTAVGLRALQNNTTGSSNTAVGLDALQNTTASSNTALGRSALQANTSGTQNTALGQSALLTTNFGNTTGLGANSVVTGNNQVQLGDSTTTTFAFGPVQNRSDLRDKTDVRDTALGLEFITALRPVDFRWDLRDDYRSAPPAAPAPEASEIEHDAYAGKLNQWREASRLANITPDGSQTRTRFHHGLIAQEVAQVIAAPASTSAATRITPWQGVMMCARWDTRS